MTNDIPPNIAASFERVRIELEQQRTEIAEKFGHINKWTNEDLEYEICYRLRNWIQDRNYNVNLDGDFEFSREMVFFVEEFNRRRPLEEEYDENGNYKGN